MNFIIENLSLVTSVVACIRSFVFASLYSLGSLFRYLNSPPQEALDRTRIYSGIVRKGNIPKQSWLHQGAYPEIHDRYFLKGALQHMRHSLAIEHHKYVMGYNSIHLSGTYISEIYAPYYRRPVSADIVCNVYNELTGRITSTASN